MKFACEGCHAQYMISDEKVGPRGVKVRCRKCNHVNVVRRPAPATDPGAVAPPPAPAFQPPAGDLDEELGAAFEQVVSGNTPGPEGEAQQDQPLEDLERTQILGMRELQRIFDDRRAPATDPERHEWYVAIDEQQVGPLRFAEVRSRWEAGSIGPDTLCWRSGMADWSPFSQIPELAAALAPIPAAAPPAASGGGWISAAMKPSEEPAPAFRPSAASALASLVEAEREAAANREPTSEATLERTLGPASESTGIRTLLQDLPSAPAPEPSRLLPIGAASAPATAPAASAPAVERKGGAGRWAIAAGVVVLLGAGAVFGLELVGGSEPAAPGAPAAPVAEAPQVEAKAPEPPAPPPAVEAVAAAGGSGGAAEQAEDGGAAGGAGGAATEAAVAAAGGEEKPAQAAPEATEKKPEESAPVAVATAQQAVRAPEPEPKKAAPKKAATTDRSSTRPSGRAAARESSPPPRRANTSSDDLLAAAGNSSIDALFEQEFRKNERPRETKPRSGGDTYIPPAPGGGGKPHQLSQGDIAGVVVGHKAALKRCADEYTSKHGGSGTVVMRWTIRPDGSTTGIQTVKGTEHAELGKCIGNLIRTWKFPDYSGPQMPPIDFPFQF